MGLIKRYKIWSDDLGYPKDDAYLVEPLHQWFDMEDTVHQLLEQKYTDWEYPDGPFNLLAQEVGEDGLEIGAVHTFGVSVDWSPDFYLTEKT